MKTCENCGNDHDGSYGSGRFCSSKCSRGFSTKAKRKEINEKLKKVQPPSYCVICGVSIEVTKRKRKTCKSAECVHKHMSNTHRGVLAKRGPERKKGSGGLRPGGGRSKTLPYRNHLGEEMKLNIEEIALAKVLDDLKLNWHRNFKGFGYTDTGGRERNFYPDFYVEDSETYIEYKGWITDKMTHKMKDAQLRNNFKLLIIYGTNPRYSKMGINLNDLERDDSILIHTMRE